ncbi:MAG: methylmalonyl-CoA mutase family protein [Holophagales bacterium]|nr:methylmalonyl-CoA mutase family protein [Holophagales bacterium]
MPRLLDEIAPVSAADWHAKVEADLRGADFRRALAHTTADGLELEPLYHPGNAEGVKLGGFPGEPPYVRGVDPPAPERAWTVAQEVDHPDPAEANRRLIRDLELGIGLAWVRASGAAAADDAACPGVRIEGPGDLETLFEGVEPTWVQLIFEPAGSPSRLAGWLDAWTGTRGPGLGGLEGGFACDPLGDLARTGGSEADLAGVYAEVGELASRFSAAGGAGRGWRLRTVAASSLVFHHAGASQAEQLAYALASGVESLRRLEARGLDAEQAADQVMAVHAVGTELFLEVAKLRAWRLLWSKVLTAAGIPAAAGRQRMHLRPSRVTATRVDPWVNLLRASVQTFAGALAGADSIVTGTYDRAWGTEAAEDPAAADHARRVAINTQHVLAEEGHLARVADPGGGSWTIETLTHTLARAAWELFRDVERRGGLATALADGAVQARIRRTVAERRARLARREESLVGVTVFPLLGESRPGMTAEPEQGERGAGRPSPSEAAIEPLEVFRAADAFERLRLAADARADSGAGRPTIFLARLGRASDARARADFAAGLFAVGGIEAVGEEATEEAELQARAFRRSGASVAVLCSSDERYGELVPAAASALLAAGATRLYLAGRPGEAEERYRAAGVSDFVYLGCDAVVVLEGLLDHLGILEAVPAMAAMGEGR